MSLPILYSYRRCPYAIRARMALRYANIAVEIREISLRDKPLHLLQVSPKATVPVLVLPDHRVIEESLLIMDWALAQSDPNGWLKADVTQARQLIAENDGTFKLALDAYKYPERYPTATKTAHRVQGERFLAKLEDRLQQRDFLLANQLTLADVAIFPFVRQFAAVDTQWFQSSRYSQLNRWLATQLSSALFIAIMEKIVITN